MAQNRPKKLRRLVKKGWVSLYEPYRDVHKDNLKAVHEQWKDKTLPKLD